MTSQEAVDANPVSPAFGALVRAYPPSWRRDGRADEILGIMLDSAEANGRGRPSAREAVDVLAHGWLARARMLDLVVSAEVRQLVVRMALPLGTAFALWCLMFGELAIPFLSDGAVPEDLTLGMNPPGHPFMTVGVLVYLGWVVMFWLYAAGRPQLYRQATVITLLITASLPTIAGVTGQQRPPGGVLLFLALLCGLALLACPSSAAPRARMRHAVFVQTAVILIVLICSRLEQYYYTVIGVFGFFGGGWGLYRRSSDSARYCFYWAGSGGSGIAYAAALVNVYSLAAAAAGALVLRRRCPNLLPAGAIVAMPVVALRLIYTSGTGSYGHIGLNGPRTVIEIALCTAVVGVILCGQSPLVRRRRSSSLACPAEPEEVAASRTRVAVDDR